MPVTGDRAGLRALQEKLKGLSGAGLGRVSKQLAEEAKHLVSEGFQAGKSPAGSAWAPLKTRSGQPLRDTGRLANSITTVDTGHGFLVGTNVVYAPIQQYGGVLTAKGIHGLYSKKLKIHFGKSVTIPARPFLPQGSELPGPWKASLEEIAEATLALILKE